MLQFILIFTAALSLSIAAAYYSIIGLVAIFAGAALPVAIMAGFMEYGKIVTAVWLHHNWGKKTFIKWYLSAAVVVLMIITSMGIFGFLSKAYLESAGEVKNNYVIVEQINRDIGLVDKEITRNEKVIEQLDSAIDRYIDMNYISKGLAEREKQEPQRKAIGDSISELRLKKNSLTEELSEAEKAIAEVEVEVGPVKYIAEIIYGTEAESNLDDAVRWVIMLLIFVFDPLAILLMIASQVSFQEWKYPTRVVTVTKDGTLDALDLSGAIEEPPKKTIKTMKERVQAKRERMANNKSQM